MSFVLFMVFGVLEIYALFALMFKTFRLPYFDYIQEISIIALTVALTSYIIRVYFDINQVIDILTHFIFYILFFRYLIKVRYWRAIVISFMYIGYAVLNIMVYLLYTSTGILTAEVLNHPNSAAAYVIQLSTAVLAFAIAYVIYRRNSGFSFIIRPPHDFFIKAKMQKKDCVIIMAVLLMLLLLSFTFYILFHYQSMVSIPLIIVSYLVLIYLAYRRDMSR